MLAAATAAMAALLVLLAILQFHWVGEVSAAARERLRRGLETAANRIADDFDREVYRAFVAFQPARDPSTPLAESLADGWERWSATALDPALIEAVYVVDPERDATGPSRSPLRLDPSTRSLEPAAWPPQLAELGVRLETGPQVSWRDPAARWHGMHGPIFGSAPALILPARRSQRSERDGEPRLDRDGEGGGLATRGHVVVLLDRAVVASSLLPSLVELHLGPESRDTEVWVLDRSGSGDPVFGTGPIAERTRHPDRDVAARPLLGLRAFPELRAQGFQPFFDDNDGRRRVESFRRPGGPRPASPGRSGVGWGGGPDTGAWTLVVARREGSLDAAVARLRRRNLGVGLAVVALLGATSTLLLLSARRAQRLAQREMELVAGITHELRTPLASIASAADNLADGVVREPDQIRRYGGLIKGETHRLGALVAQVLDFAGSAATGRRVRPVEPVDLGAIVDRVLEDHRFTIEEKGFAIERRQAASSARALADADALRRALDNVVGNALKYGEAGRWLGIEIGPGASGAAAGHAGAAAGKGGERDARGRVALRVRDRGPGIARADRRRVFEPFYRGPGTSAPHLHGTGLGLAVTKSVIESLGGTIEIEDSDAGRGTTFLITLLAAPPEEAPESEPIEAAP